jgi:aminopeptidase N
MAALSLAKATRFGDVSWQEFNLKMKVWAEVEDQLSTTHPIQGSVVDTESTFLNFDGITYGKGASVLKQLMAVISEDSFKAGMRYYFQKHQWSNTTIHDFLAALEHGYSSLHANKIDLKQWSAYWLETAVRTIDNKTKR